MAEEFGRAMRELLQQDSEDDESSFERKRRVKKRKKKGKMCEMGSSYKDPTEQMGDKVGASASKMEEMQSRIRSLEEELRKKDELQKQEKFAAQVEQFLQMTKQVQRTLCGMGDFRDAAGQTAGNIGTSGASASKMEEMQSRIHFLEEEHQKQEKFATQMQQEQLQRTQDQYQFFVQLVDRMWNLETTQAKITKYLKIMPVQQQESGQPPLQYATGPSFQPPGYGSPFDSSQQTKFGCVQPIQDSQQPKFGSSTQVQGSHSQAPVPQPAQPVEQVRNSQSLNFQDSQPTKDNRPADNNAKGLPIRVQGSQFPQPPRPLPVQPVQLVPKSPTPNLQGSQPTKDNRGADRTVKGQKSDPKYGGPKE